MRMNRYSDLMNQSLPRKITLLESPNRVPLVSSTGRVSRPYMQPCELRIYFKTYILTG